MKYILIAFLYMAVLLNAWYWFCPKYSYSKQDILSHQIEPNNELNREFKKAFKATGITNEMTLFHTTIMSRGNATSYFTSGREYGKSTNAGPWVTIARNQDGWFVVSNGNWKTANDIYGPELRKPSKCSGRALHTPPP